MVNKIIQQKGFSWTPDFHLTIHTWKIPVSFKCGTRI